MPFEIISLIREVYRQTELQRTPPPYVTRLVKLLYLADLEWRRTHSGEPIANLTWRFLHFGPYANELADLLGGPELEVTELEQGKEARRFTFGKETEESGLPNDVVGLLRQLVRKWGDVQLNKLLDYVYFDTEPMENAKRYELLDFSRLSPSSPVNKPLFNQARIADLRNRLKNRARELQFTRNGIHVPSVDIASEGAWDDETDPLSLPTNIPIRHSAE